MNEPRLDTAAFKVSYDHAQHAYRIAQGGNRVAAHKAYVRAMAAQLAAELAGIPKPKAHRKFDEPARIAR